MKYMLTCARFQGSPVREATRLQIVAILHTPVYDHVVPKIGADENRNTAVIVMLVCRELQISVCVAGSPPWMRKRSRGEPGVQKFSVLGVLVMGILGLQHHGYHKGRQNNE